MKNTFRVVLFSLVIGLFYFAIRDFLPFDWTNYVSLALTMMVIIIGFIIFFENRHPTQTLTWLVVLGAFPLLGFFFYLLFGRSYRKEKTFKQKYILDQKWVKKYFSNTRQELLELPSSKRHQNFYQLTQKLSQSPITFATETKVLTDGKETFSTIIEELEKAQHHIHFQYYIVRNDELGNKIADILIKKAESGVQVRFMYDAVGSWSLSKKYIHRLKQAGVDVVAFNPVYLPFLNNKFNYRNHRKIIVIDGDTGFMGGLNVGDEYLGKSSDFGYWRDTHLILKGEGVRNLQLIFFQDWFYMTNESFLTPGYLHSTRNAHIPSLGGVQLIAGGPDSEWSTMKNLFFSMITSAKKSVWIASPYFIPDDDIFTALKVAALSGIDVKLLVPAKPDKRIVFHASRSYFPELMEAGGKVYEYERGFMHSKILMIDDDFASIGTANMDMRSFHLNFEVNAFLYETESIKTLRSDFQHDLSYSKELDLELFNKRHVGYRILESTSRLLSPLL